MSHRAALTAWAVTTLVYLTAMMFVVFAGAPRLAILMALIAGPAAIATVIALTLVEDRSRRGAR